ncbi:uncharacterized protein [Haliotis asinina]|uniref:uncharacterized protein n=1 Tax=Haliotis asinina TaxID=109174 RepID=UPI0035325A0F
MARFSAVLFIAMVLVIVQSSSAEETCQSLGGTCKGPLWSEVKCDGQKRFPMAGCGSSVCCLPPKPATCQDMGGTCKVPVPSGIRCDGLLKYATPGCAANEWCCEPDPKTTPEPKTTPKQPKTCASACGKCQSNQYGCQGYTVNDVTDCNQPNESCCVRYWTGPCEDRL